MGTEIFVESMDRLIDELEKRDPVQPMTPRKAIKLYYPRLKAIKDKKGYTVKDLYSVFLEMNPDAGISEKTFVLYWQRARRDHMEAGGAPKKNVETSIVQIENSAQASEVVVFEPEKTVRPIQASIDEEYAKKSIQESVAESAKPKKSAQAAEKEKSAHVPSKLAVRAAVKSGAAVQPQPKKPAFMAEADIKAKDELLIKRCGGIKS